MYDLFSTDYDRFVNWRSRLSFEMPFIEATLTPLLQQGNAPVKILDSACGTGMHVIELRQRGYLADGADLSQGMIKAADKNASAAGVSARFEAAGFGSLAQKFSSSPGYDAVLCLGNSLPHLLSLQEIESALRDFASCMRPGGKLMVQNRNFDAVMLKGDRWMEPQSFQEADKEWIFLRFYDFLPNGLINFHIISLQRSISTTWTQKVYSTMLFPLTNEDFTKILTQCGFGNIRTYGGMDGSSFNIQESGNLVVVAERVK